MGLNVGNRVAGTWGRSERFCVIGLALVASGLPSAEAAAATPAGAEVRYGEHIRPILSDRCFKCHGPDAATRQAELRLDAFDVVTADRGGYAVVVPGDAESSELWRRINATHADDIMPPPHSAKKPLSDDEKRLVRRWIEAGAEYEPHWAYVTPQRPPLPDVRNADRVRTPIDRFILARLDAHGIDPAPDASAETVIRRLFLDVTGLPPTPDEIDRFLEDDDADAYERWVDRLLTEEPYRSRFAEHWATSWLDAARYGDTSGIHMDNGRQIWLWRDWVLAAFRDNLPYDRFVVEQIAGDLLPDATVEQKIASGFNRNHVTTDEVGAISAEYLVEYAVDRVSTTSSVFLGLTAGCARCHDHKFDPISQEEFYELTAFFNSVDEPGLYSQTADANRAYEPFLEVPTPEQQETLHTLDTRIESLEAEMATVPPEEVEERDAYLRALRTQSGVRWTLPEVVEATSSDERVTLEPQDDGSLLATGPMPDQENYVVRLRTPESALRLVLIEALPTPGAGPGAGRASHGNAVISRLAVETRAAGSDAPWQPITMRWAWSDHNQLDRDFEATNLIRRDDTLGWAADGNQFAGQRLLCLLAEEPFGFEAGTELRLTFEFRSPFFKHSLGRVRLRLGTISEDGLAMLPATLGRWRVAGHFPVANRGAAFATEHGPELLTSIAAPVAFGADGKAFRFDATLVDERVVRLPGGVGSNYVARTIFTPTARLMKVSLGSDDGYRLFVNGVEIAKEEVDRGAAPDQSVATVPLRAGMNSLVMKIVNTGGPSGYYFRVVRDERAPLTPGLVSGLVPPEILGTGQAKELAAVYRRLVSPAYRKAETALAEAQAARADLQKLVPRTMVMKDLQTPRDTYVLIRGQYDHPDTTRPVTANVPAVLGRLADDVPKNRLGLAQWMMTPDNPLVARVAANRMWQLVFGTGLVRTSDDFGFQGEWPSHPELLDWLAVELRERDWDTQHLLRMILTSSVYRQQSRVRGDVAEADPDNRLLAWFPRQRLSAEQIRDQALYASGLLRERLGGPSVKPYQPAGLWREVAMPNSNTRTFQRGDEDELWRRSLYTYWKRASPPPSLQTFDAPTREACVVRRPITNTPLQALVLWNDEQFVEAARMLATRTLDDAPDDDTRLVRMFRRCTGRTPEPAELTLLRAGLAEFRTRYSAAPDDAEGLLAVGVAPRPEDVPPPELAAWTVLASSILSLHESITRD
ncbi:MAG: DUF1553 domain-containing protein [Phycisphaerales bacterium]|nr:DUF1553 domain-containing protein [Phycisphaerales bacterium]